MYRFSRSGLKGNKVKGRAHLLGSGAILNESIKAAALLDLLENYAMAGEFPDNRPGREPAVRAYEKVLVAVAFSRACARAVSAANRIAPGAELSSFHALYIPFMEMTGGDRSPMARVALADTEKLAADWTRQYGLLGTPPEVTVTPSCCAPRRISAGCSTSSRRGVPVQMRSDGSPNRFQVLNISTPPVP